MTQNSQVRRALSAFLFLAVILIGNFVSVETSVAASDDVPSDGIASFGQCLAVEKQGSLVVLMDQSSSLHQSDPGHARVVTSQYLVERWASYVEETGVKIDVRVSGFADSYRPVGDWTSLSASSLEDIRQDLVTSGQNLYEYDTDYWLALEGARQDLAGHSSSRKACRAIAWFTDGDYEVNPRLDADSRKQFGTEKAYAPGVSIVDGVSAQQVSDSGKKDICRPTGLADQLRSSGIVLLGVGLSEGENSWPFLRSVILGGGENAKAQGVDSCGDLSTPPGTFVAAYDLDSLYTAIDRISRPGATNAPLETPIICQGTVCESGEVSFVLDQSLETVHVMSTSNVPNLTVYVYPPDEASPIKLMPGGKTGQDTGVSYEWLTERTLQFDLDSKSVKTWDGIWRMVFVDEKSQSAGQHVQVNLSLSSPLVLSWTNIARASFVADEPLMGAELSILDKAGGSPIDVTKLKGTVAMTVILKDSAGNTSTLFESEDTGVLGKSLTFDIDELALGSAMVTTTLQVSTASATTKDGTVVPSRPLAPVSIETQVQIETPPDYPTVASAVDFGLLDGVTTAEGTLAVTGPGCVWLPESEPHLEAVPNGVGQVGVNSNADSINNCVNLADGEKGSLPITFSVAESANGLVVGKASVSIAPTDSGADTRSTTVSFTADMRKPLNVQVAWVTFVIVLLLGVGIPVGIFYVFKVRAAVFVPGTGAWGIARAELPDGERGEARISLNAADMTYFSIARRTRTFSAGGYTFRTRIGALPTSGPRAELVDAGPSVSGKLGQRKGCAQVLLFLPGQWVAVLDQPDSPRAATVVVLANSNDPMEVEAMLADVRRDLAERVTDLKASASVKSDSTSTPSPEQKGATSENVSSPFGQSSSFGAASTATGNTNLPFSTTDSFGSQLVKPFGTDTSFSIDPPLGPESPSTGESPSSGNPFI